MTLKDVVFTDRYGGKHPDLKNVCKGQCEGMGVVPIFRDEKRHIFKKLWEEAERRKHAEDGYHFVKCPKCNGTGKRVV